MVNDLVNKILRYLNYCRFRASWQSFFTTRLTNSLYQIIKRMRSHVTQHIQTERGSIISWHSIYANTPNQASY